MSSTMIVRVSTPHAGPSHGPGELDTAARRRMSLSLRKMLKGRKGRGILGGNPPHLTSCAALQVEYKGKVAAVALCGGLVRPRAPSSACSSRPEFSRGDVI